MTLHSQHAAVPLPPSHPRVVGSRPSWVEELARALLRAEDSNVLVVDWVYGASFAYNLVVEIYKEVAVQISILINKLQVREGPPAHPPLARCVLPTWVLWLSSK